MNTFETIKKFAKEKKIDYNILEHAHVHTSRDAAIERGYAHIEDGMKRGAKALILRSEGKFYQFVLPGNKKIDFKKVRKILDTDSVSLATPEQVVEVIGVEIGAVPPCATLFDIPTYVDKTLLDNLEIDFNPGSHTHTMTMKTNDWVKLVEPDVEDFVL